MRLIRHGAHGELIWTVPASRLLTRRFDASRRTPARLFLLAVGLSGGVAMIMAWGALVRYIR